MSNKRRKLKKGILSLFMTAIMVVAAVGFIKEPSVHAAPANPVNFQLIVQPAPNSTLPQNFHVDWQLVKKSDSSVVNPNDVLGSPTSGSFNETNFASIE